MHPTSIAEIVQQPPELLDERQTAELLNVKPGTLAIWRCTGRWSLPYVRVGRAVRYRRADIEAWLAARTCGKNSLDGVR